MRYINLLSYLLTYLMTNRKSHMWFRLTPRLMILGDLELLCQILSTRIVSYRRISRDFAILEGNNG